ncbi:MAG: START domain-containing protein [Verrucomicrobia bacterium]|nr:START domain-containing protein [Verrucomicrobiota bacterium]
MTELRALAGCLLLGLSTVQANSAGWKKVDTEDGVTVYEKDVGEMVAFRGEGQITAPIGKLLYVIEDSAHWKEWIENFDKGHLIQKKADFHKIFYQAFDSPFPASDRDIVYEARTRRDASTGKVYVEMRSVLHPKAPKTVGVRVNLKYTRYEITPLKEGCLHVVLETLSNPGGSLPDFLVNWAQRDYPVKLFQGLRRQVKKNHAKLAPVPPAK